MGRYIPEDLQFIIDNYFSDITITGTQISKYEYYHQRQEISNLFGYKLWSKEFLSLLYKEAEQIIKRDVSPNFIALQLLSFLDDIKIIRLGYTTMQDMVSTSLTNERNRISNILDYELTQDYKLKLDNLIISNSSLSKLVASFKQDAKNFGFKMMFKEREKHNILESLYTPARDIIKKLNISQRNINILRKNIFLEKIRFPNRTPVWRNLQPKLFVHNAIIFFQH